MWIEIDDELFPHRSSLVGLWFDSKEEFLRCELLVWEHHCYYEADREADFLMVRKSDAHLLAAIRDAGLHYREVELRDPPELSPEEAYERDRAACQRAMQWFLERLRQEQ